MASIDDRIVNMAFNNQQFQQGITQTNASLTDLNNNLKLPNAASGINAAQQAANGFSLANMESALQNISSKFSVFGAVGFTVIQSLVNTALTAGQNIAASLIDPLVNGGAKRALALQQAKFQFRGLGLDIEATMAAALAAVKGTAFGLDDAALAAGQFGASGIVAGAGLETALRAVAGVAAQTGGDFAGVAQIFEKVAGNGRLMGQDLLSLSSRGINAAATLAKSMGVTESAVREMVSAGEISFQQFSDAMNAAFGANAAKANETYTGALSNMNAALARIGASVASPYFLGMRDIFNSLGPLFDDIHVAITPLIEDFNLFQEASAARTVDGIDKLLGPNLVVAIQNVVSAIQILVGILDESFHSIFPDDTPSQLFRIGKFIKDVTAALIPNEETADKLRRTFAGVFAIFSIVGQIVNAVVKTFSELLGVVAPAGGSFLDITANLGDFLVRVDEFLKKGNYFKNFFQTLGGILAVPLKLIQSFFGIVADGIESLNLFDGATASMDSFADRVAERFSGLVDLGRFFNQVWQGVVGVAQAVWGVLKPIFVGIGNFIADAVNNIRTELEKMKFDDVMQILNTGIFAAGTGGLLGLVNGFFGNIGGVLQGNGQTIISSMKLAFGGLITNLKALEMNTNAKTLTQIAIAVALLAASAVAMSMVDADKLGLAMAAIVTSMGALLASMSILGKIGGFSGITKALVLSIVLQSLATSILVLSAAVAILGALPLQNIIQGVAGIVVILGALVGALAAMAKVGPNVLAGAAAIALIAPAMVLLAAAVAILGALPIENLVSGVSAFVIILGVLVGALALLSKIGPTILFSVLPLMIIAPAITTFAAAVALLGALPLDNLIQGVTAFVVIIGTLVGAVALLNLLGPQTILAAAAILLISYAIVPLIGAITAFGALPLANIIQGIVGLALVLGILVLTVAALGAIPEVTLLGAAALIIIAAAIAILAPALVLLSAIPWEGIGKIMTVLAAGLGILVVMGILLIPASVGFLLLGVALLALGTGVYLAAQGLGMLVIGIAALVGIGAAGITVFTLALVAFMEHLPQLGAAMGTGIVAMAVAIGEGAPQLVAAFVAVLTSMLDAIIELVPKIIETATVLIVALINALIVLIPLLVQAGLEILVGILEGIENNIERIVELSVLIIANFINGLAAGLPTLLQAGANLILSWMNGIANTIRNNRQKFVDAALNIADAITGGLSTGLLNGVQTVINAVQNLVSHIPQAIKDFLGIASPSKVVAKLMEFVGSGAVLGLNRGEKSVTIAAEDLGNAALTGLKSTLANIGTALNEGIDMSPTIRPLVDLTDVQNASRQIPGLFQSPSLSLDRSNDVAQSVSLLEQQRNAQLVLDKDTPTVEQTALTYIQNNNSPKALSTIEIYRQTNNQLSRLKGDLGVVDQSGSP